MSEGIDADVVKGVAETADYAGAAIGDALSGDWDKAADNALSMSENALGVATFGVSKGLEEAWDDMAKDNGLPAAHDGLQDLAKAGGDLLGDGLSDLVGPAQSAQSLQSFDSGDILGGIGHMAEGAAGTIGTAVDHGLSDIGDAITGALGGGPDTGSAGGQPDLSQPPLTEDDPGLDMSASQDAEPSQ
ncbi:MAG: hypothetical protein ACLP70_08340 [Streptosporangiaceae bacterium]|jgi:hypothetical protein